MSGNKPLKVLVLAHDLSDAAIRKRIMMLSGGGADVSVAGFRRTDQPITEVAGRSATNLGQTKSAGFLQRILSVLRETARLQRHKKLFINADVIVARNLEMLALAVRGRALSNNLPSIVYESLDIHRLLLKQNVVGKILRRLEGWLSSHASLLITSSPAFITNYFETLSEVRTPILLLENKVLVTQEAPSRASLAAPGPEETWKIGWFGIIRCKRSLKILSDLVRQYPGKIEVIIRGKPALNEFDDFHGDVAKVAGISFEGAYKSPEDLQSLYGQIHFTWAIDLFEEGLNSSWLLPNRIYEGGFYGSVPIALSTVETGRYLENLSAGVVLDKPLPTELARFFGHLTASSYETLAAKLRQLPTTTWAFNQSDCRDLVQKLSSLPAPQNNSRS